MPRSRMIKPEFWSDEKLSRFKPATRLFYIGLWNFSDDYGRVKGNINYLWSALDPYRTVSKKIFEKAIVELEKAGKILAYSVNDELFYSIPNFLKHQRISKPSKTMRNPDPPENIILVEEKARRSSGMVEDEAEAESESETEINKKKQ